MNRFAPKYKLLWEKNYQFLLAGKKLLNKRKYIVTQDPDFKLKEDLLLLGKVEVNKEQKTSYTFYDDGVKPSMVNSFTKKRKQLGGIFYDAKADGPKRPRKVTFLQNINGKEILTFLNR